MKRVKKNIQKGFDYVWNIINGAAGTKPQYSYSYKPSPGASSNELTHRMRAFGWLEVNFRESEL